MKTSTKRHLVKSLSWRVVAVFTTSLVTFLLTQSITLAITLGLIDTVLKLLFYYYHELIWSKILWLRPLNTPVVVWMTGLSGAGKTSIAQELVKILNQNNRTIHSLDGDEIRKIFPDTGFDRESRHRHVKRVGYLAAQLEMNSVSSVVALISPSLETRAMCRSLCTNFVEVYISTSLADCEKRDPKGLYKRARSGEIKNVSGLDSPYEAPIDPEITLTTHDSSPKECAMVVFKYLKIFEN
jgi:adenylylsulfate kinase